MKKTNELLELFQKDSNKDIVNIKCCNSKSYKIIGEFWTSKQRQANSIHEISYRACFKPQLPNFFIKHFSKESDLIYDPFSGRGTTLIEAALLNRNIVGNDINPLSKILIEPRICPPTLEEIEKRVAEIKIDYDTKADIDLSMFYHPKTESEIVSIKNYILEKERNNALDMVDKWIRMVATNRLTGHSKGFFSVYSMPPNQAVSPQRQILINKKRNQVPEYKDVKQLIIKKSKSLLKDITFIDKSKLCSIYKQAILLNKDARETQEIPSNSVQLIVTSPPFLNVVQYAHDNWLRCWFNGIDAEEIEKKMTLPSNIDEWTDIMQQVFYELYRVTKPNGYVAFEVGEVKNGKVKLDEYIAPIGIDVGFKLLGIMINKQNFTKTSNIWGINNNKKGTNTNRIVVFKKEA